MPTKHRTFAFSDLIYNWLSPKPHSLEEETNELLKMLSSEEPCMISRFGSVELQALSYIRYKPFFNFIKKRAFYTIYNNAGFFPINNESLRRFYELHKNDAKEIDALVSWRFEEFLFMDWLRSKYRIRKSTFDSFYSQEQPWTKALKFKRVLVIHPFAESIQKQYNEKRERLFANPNVLPEFKSLTIIKAVQSIAGNDTEFKTWFDALDWMIAEINKCDFDVALIGCGAYGLPLAAHVKRIGKKAVHMGGILQFLFGIKSIRYEENPTICKYINEHFVYPNESERPQNANLVEGGCYWGK